MSALDNPPKLILITDTRLFAVQSLLERFGALAGAARPGELAVQLRDHQLSGRARWWLGQRLREICEHTGQWLIVNDRLDLAFALAAHGVHLGEGSVAAREVANLAGQLGRRVPWISCSAHDLSALTEASSEDRPDAWLVSPIAQARKGRAALGFAGLARYCREAAATSRIYALGAIDADNAQRCLEHGASGVAVVGAAFAPAADWRRLLQVLAIERA